MKSIPRLVWLAALSLALAACQGEKETAQQGSAEGEILPGSASDAMLPYDTVRSQPPLAPMPAGTGRASARDGDGTEEADAEDGEPAEEPPGEPPTEETAAPEPTP